MADRKTRIFEKNRKGWREGRKPVPTAVAQAVFQRANNACEECGYQGRLELHHLTYDKPYHGVPEPIFGNETPNDLLALCRECHIAEHFDENGRYWDDPDEKYQEWEPYYTAIERND